MYISAINTWEKICSLRFSNPQSPTYPHTFLNLEKKSYLHKNIKIPIYWAPESICSSLALLVSGFEIYRSDCKSWRYSRMYRKTVIHILGSCKICIFSAKCCYTNFSLNLHTPGSHVKRKMKLYNMRIENIQKTAKV